MIRLVLTMLWLALAALGGSEHACAHAALVDSHPLDGAVVEQSPAMVRLRFNEPVSALTFVLVDARGRTHRELAIAAWNDALDVTMPPDLPRGSHILSYRVTSSDGHPTGGTVLFSVGAPTQSHAARGAQEIWEVQATLWLTRVILYLGMFAGAGGVFFMAWVAPGTRLAGGTRLLGWILAGGLAAAAASLGLQGLDALGQPLAALATPAAWAAGCRTSYGTTVAVAWAGLLHAGGSLRSRTDGWRRGLSLAGLAYVGVALASSGHAGAASPQWLTRPAVFLHAVSVTYWVGALLPLVLLIRQSPGVALPTVRRFSTGAVGAVVVLTLSGLALGLVQVGSLANLPGTAYGQVLIAKIALVAGLLGLAAMNRLLLTPGLAAPGGCGRTRFVRSVTAEIVLAAAILALVGLWRFTPPPRTLAPAAEAAPAASIHLHKPEIMAQVTLLPARAGAVQAGIVIASGRAELISPVEVTLILSKPDAGIGPLERPARKAGRDWQVDGLLLPLPGPWQVRIEILVNDFEKAALEGSITLRP